MGIRKPLGKEWGNDSSRVNPRTICIDWFSIFLLETSSVKLRNPPNDRTRVVSREVGCYYYYFYMEEVPLPSLLLLNRNMEIGCIFQQSEAIQLLI
ncbi:hypothetical protein AVEN_73137-1 [Araneus ventricosus]|uniref:Uncharacterized protein n=1 Tax=Araneus ventricosus TaxID=182803 RepID=A0A4Y2RVW9_ARAVE|nr:hypothetical protein AVEN_227676-1 [Araneus ventricosus]GBN79389.1 hypothetical protein AVEN_260653-1 [Araneus ventricosus]GBN79391.1 hypothetical protein AVEN_171813-1 [Araneus ventricosus]GBN79709.1 hypothetical protein AVEN_73137-1 [Araneus ventricosus]